MAGKGSKSRVSNFKAFRDCPLWDKTTGMTPEERERVEAELCKIFELEKELELEKSRIEDRPHAENCPYLWTGDTTRCDCKKGDWVIGRRGPRQLGVYDG